MKQKHKKTLIIISLCCLGVAIALVIARFASEEDTWLCENGQWVKHGSPSADKPSEPCLSSEANSNSLTNQTTNIDTVINSYEDCVVAGNPVMESYPPKCSTGSGKTFTQNIGNELEMTDYITIDSPRPNDVVVSPLQISGQAVGSWYFEAVFPITLTDENNKTLATISAQSQSDWMTQDFVSFTASLEFDQPDTDTGFLILQNANPSGLPEHQKTLTVPVHFE